MLITERERNLNDPSLDSISLGKEEIQKSIEELGVPVNIRGEALSLEQFAKLSNIINAKMKQD